MGTRAKETTREFFFPFVRPLFRPSPLTEKATAPNPSPLLRHRPFCSQFRSLAGFPFHLIPQQETSSQAEVSPVLKIKNLLFKLVKFADSVSLCSLAPLVAVLYMNAKKKKKTKGEKKTPRIALFLAESEYFCVLNFTAIFLIFSDCGFLGRIYWFLRNRSHAGKNVQRLLICCTSPMHPRVISFTCRHVASFQTEESHAIFFAN